MSSKIQLINTEESPSDSMDIPRRHTEDALSGSKQVLRCHTEDAPESMEIPRLDDSVSADDNNMRDIDFTDYGSFAS